MPYNEVLSRQLLLIFGVVDRLATGTVQCQICISYNGKAKTATAFTDSDGYRDSAVLSNIAVSKE